MSGPAPCTRRLAIVLGDTAGHVYPAIAITEAWRRHHDAVDILLIGPRHNDAPALARQAGYAVSMVDAQPIARAGFLAQAAAPIHVAITIRQSRRLLADHQIKLVIGLGGFASGGVLLAARSLGLRTAILEPNVEPGLANRLLARVAHRIYLGHEPSTPWVPPSRRLTTGHPIRAAVAALAAIPATPRCAPTGRPVRVLVMGGARASDFLAKAVPPLLRAISTRDVTVEVRHQNSSSDTSAMVEAYRDSEIDAAVLPFITDIAAEYRWADFVIARAGASTLAELAAAGLPSLLVPMSEAAANHQEVNARAFADAGAALWTRESEWNTSALAERVGGLIHDDSAWARMSAAAQHLAVPDAADTIVADNERLMAGRW